MCSSAAVGRLLQVLMCCIFRDAFLQIFVVMSDYLSFHCLPIIPTQCGHSPLTYDSNKGIFPWTAAHWIFSLGNSL